MAPRSPEDFLQVLSETISWCKDRWDPAKPAYSLRSAATRPTFGPNDHPDGDPPYLFVDEPKVAEVIAARGRELKRSACRLVPPDGELHGGRLVSLRLDVSTFEGLLPHETGRYLDAYDNPPWDTWIDIVASDPELLLCSWVPPQAITLMDRAMKQDSYALFEWVDEPSTRQAETHSGVPNWLRSLARPK